MKEESTVEIAVRSYHRAGVLAYALILHGMLSAHWTKLCVGLALLEVCLFAAMSGTESDERMH